jgi:hypothetical protein
VSSPKSLTHPALLKVLPPKARIIILTGPQALKSGSLANFPQTDGIDARHIFDRFPIWETRTLLMDICRHVVAPGGYIYVEVANLEALSTVFPTLKTLELQWTALNHLYGDPTDEYPRRSSYSPLLLTEMLEQSGFGDIQIIDMGLMLGALARKPVPIKTWTANLLD